ncbi:2-oxoacid:acceptor oxidoreductase family protein [candidate division NPL-UPA2 bacterium]|nr:2-oxoacid:acceptor oxidoreductase family protein [candidate division NPL-UPA2 bacterium]
MHEEIIMAGFGGQGVIFMGKLLAYLGMQEGHQVTYIPSYGAEVRGGTANCTVIISSEEIASPLSPHPSTAIVMNKPSLDKFEPRIKREGLLILNSSLISREANRDDLEIMEVPATEIATRLGNSCVANMVALGAYMARKKVVSLGTALDHLRDVLPERSHHLLDINKKALKEGAKLK